MSALRGICTFATIDGMPPAALATSCEALGFESLWLAEHTHWPVPQGTPLPGGGTAPEFFAATLDPFVALTSAAMSTSELRVGTGLCLLAQHDSIVTAKAVSTLDRLSGGRFEFGVGAGWNHRELRNHGVDPADRWAVLEESLEVVRRLWCEPVASFAGKYRYLSPSEQQPKPLQRPHPPILVGGGYPRGMQLAVRLGVGWMPQPPALGTSPAARIAEFRRAWEAAGHPGSGWVSVYGVMPPDVEEFATADRIIFWLEPGTPAAMEQALRELADANLPLQEEPDADDGSFVEGV